jgi:hypothetical protein
MKTSAVKHSRPASASSRKPAPPPQPTFTADDLIAALSMPTGGDGLTAYELSQKLGRPPAWVSQRIRTLHRAGAPIEGSKAPRPDICGVMRYVPVYRMKPAT